MVKTEGKPKPGHEVKHIAFWKPGSKIKLGKGTEEVIERYLSLR